MKRKGKFFMNYLNRSLHFSLLALSEQVDHAYSSLQELSPETRPEKYFVKPVT